MADVFEYLDKNYTNFIQAQKGSEFEDRIVKLLNISSFVKLNSINKKETINDIQTYEFPNQKNISKQDKNLINKKWDDLKQEVLSKNNIEIIKNPFKTLKNHFIVEPYGSQNFPDILVFCGSVVFPIEIKFSKTKNSRPTWNSNLPKSLCIYIFAIANEGLTFFKGEDFLSNDVRIALNNFFDDLTKKLDYKSLKEKIKTQEENNIFGLYPYVRKAFQYSKEFCTLDVNINIFEKELNKKWHNNVIKLIKGDDSDE